MKKFIPILLLLLPLTDLFSQRKETNIVDSLTIALKTANNDTSRIKTINLLAFEYTKIGNADTALILTNNSLTQSKKISFTRGEADAYFFMGQAYAAKPNNTDALINYLAASQLYEKLNRKVDLAETYYAMGMIHQRINYDEAIQFFKKGLKVSEQTTVNDLSGKIAYYTAVVLIRKSEYDEASAYMNRAIKYYSISGSENGLANCYVVSARINNQRGNIQQSLKDNYAALRLFEKTGSKIGMFNVYTGLGLMYEDQKNWKEALNNYLASKKAAEELNIKDVISAAYNNMGNAYRELGQVAEAQQAFEEALKLATQSGNKKSIASAQGNLGTIFSLNGNNEQALKYFLEAKTRFKEIGSKESVVISCYEAGNVYFKMRQLDKSRESVEEGLALAIQLNYKDMISKSYYLLSQIDTARGNYSTALNHFQQYVIYRDSLTNAESTKLLAEQRMQYQFSKREDSMQMQQELIAGQLEKQKLLSQQQQQDIKLKQAALELAQKQKDVQMLTFLKEKAELELSNEQQEKKLALADQEKSLKESELEKQTLIAKQKEQELLLKNRKIEVQQAQRNIWLAGALVLLVFSFIIFRNYHQKKKANQLLKQQNIELEFQRDQVKKAMTELQQTQMQLIHKEKMASLGELTAGIAHEIQNPLNFVNNFSEVNVDLGNELKEHVNSLNLSSEDKQNLHNLADELQQNQERIHHHGIRAGAIVRNMLQHTRINSGTKEKTDINALVQECLDLSYHGFRNKDKNFSTKLETNYDQTIDKTELIPQDISRVLLNLFNNAFYAVKEKKKHLNGSYEPIVTACTKMVGNKIQISVSDNGVGISENVTKKVFQPFFTTKPAGEGAGLGLSLSYDVITKGHNGEMKMESQEGEGAKFTILIPTT